MADALSSTHSDLMDLRAKGKKLHRRTQSHTTFTLNEVINKKNSSEEFFQEMLQNHNILNGDVTQKVLDAANREENEKEVIVDDIDEVPNTGIIIPQGLANNPNNPMNGIQKRGLATRNSFQNPGSQFKKIDMISQVRNIDDLIGLGTIHEKRNSMESIDTETMKKSLNVTNSGSSSQNISKVVSRTHSKHPSLDFRIGNSNNSSIDFRPMHSKQSSAEMWSFHSKQSSADFRPTHSKQSSADFRTLNKDFAHGIRIEKEIDIIKYNLLSPKTVKVSDTIQVEANNDYFDKRNRFINELQKSSVDKVKRGNSGTDRSSTKIATNTNEAKPKLKVSQTLETKDKGATAKVEKPQTASKHRRTYSGNAKANEITSPKNDLVLSAVFLNGKNPRESTEKAMSPNRDMIPEKQHIEKKDIKKTNTLDDPMRKLTTKTDLLEGQIKNIFTIIESFSSEKTQLEEKIHLQDRKIKELMELTSKYQEEIKVLKGKNEHKPTQDNQKKVGMIKGENSGLNVLTTTDGSAFESTLTESSGCLSNKDSRMKMKMITKASLTPHGQTKVQIPKGEDRKSPGPAVSKIDQNVGLTKKTSLGFKKPVLKKN